MISSIVIISLALGFFLGFIHFIGEGIRIPEGSKHYHIISFASGISIGYLFLDLLPHTYDAAEHLKGGVFFFLLIGFALVHLVEKYFYQHAGAAQLKHEFKTFHSITFFVYYFLAGFVVVELVQKSVLEGILFVFPVTLHAGLSSASLSEIHGRFKPTLSERILLSLATPAGVLLAFAFPSHRDGALAVGDEEPVGDGEEDRNHREDRVHDEQGYEHGYTPTMPANPRNARAMMPEVVITMPGPLSPLGMSPMSFSFSLIAATTMIASIQPTAEPTANTRVVR